MLIPDRCRHAFFYCGLIAALVAACASSNVLSVRYQLPIRPAESIPRSVGLVFEDSRKANAFLTPMAREELEGFTNVYALTVSRPGGTGELKGAYEVGPLLVEILRHRLENAGVRVAAPGAKAEAEFRFVLKEFLLDFGDRKWSSTIGYEAQMVKSGDILSKQTVSGSAERVMLMKKADAEKVLGELLTDAINRMDLAMLFKQAGL